MHLISSPHSPALGLAHLESLSELAPEAPAVTPSRLCGSVAIVEASMASPRAFRRILLYQSLEVLCQLIKCECRLLSKHTVLRAVPLEQVSGHR